MNLLRFSLIGLSLILFSYHLFLFFSTSDVQQAGGGPIARFIQVDEATLTIVKERLAELKKPDSVILEPAKRKDFGRKTLFLPD